MCDILYCSDPEGGAAQWEERYTKCAGQLDETNAELRRMQGSGHRWDPKGFRYWGTEGVFFFLLVSHFFSGWFRLVSWRSINCTVNAFQASILHFIIIIPKSLPFTFTFTFPFGCSLINVQENATRQEKGGNLGSSFANGIKIQKAAATARKRAHVTLQQDHTKVLDEADAARGHLLDAWAQVWTQCPWFGFGIFPVGQVDFYTTGLRLNLAVFYFP